MSDAYDELINGETFLRGSLNAPHERLCDRLHDWVARHLPANSALRLLPRRASVTLRPGARLRPDLALVRRDSGHLYLAAEVLQPGDHHPDTVLKKQLYADCRVPRLWIVDSRYQNVETYGTDSLGFRLESILVSHDSLADPAFGPPTLLVADLFKK